MAKKKKHEEQLQYFEHFYNLGRDRVNELRPMWDEYLMAFESSYPEGDTNIGDDWRSNVRIQYAKQQILTLASQLSVDDLPSFSVEPRHYTQDEYARVVQGMNSYWFDRDNYVEKRQLSAIIAGIYGGCPVKIHWLFRTQKLNVRDPESGGIREIDAVVDDRPIAEIVHPDNFFYDPKASNQEQWRFAGQRAVIPMSTLKAAVRSDGSDMYDNLDMLEDGLRAAEEEAKEPNKSSTKSKVDRDGVEVIELWTRERIIVRAGGNVIIRDEPNPFHHGRIPFVLIMTQPSPVGDSWGMSEIDPIVDAQKMLHGIDQSAQNALKLSINPPISVDVTVDPANAEKPIAPGERYVGKGNAAEFIQPVSVTGVDYFTGANASDHIQSKMEFSTGITREIAGQSSAGSATEAAINERQSKSRITLKLRSVDNGWAKVAEQFIMLGQQFLDTTQPVRIMGAEGERWVEVDPMQIAGLWSVRPRNSSERALKEIQIENNSRMLEVIMPLLSPEFVTASGKTVDAEKLIAKFVEVFDLDPQEVLVDAELLHEQVVKAQQTFAMADAEAMAQQMVEELLGGMVDGQGDAGGAPVGDGGQPLA